ncbi:MAG TPA: sigma-70 family RNA polymerase sigma factor [Vicinamibacterales bacterium]|nr:sigma-70 family RNA polymerase sigma factor [Vicinamibacterales bacterium]
MAEPPPSGGERPPDLPPAVDPDATVHLLERVRAGDADALERLYRRYLPSLRRWAHGRLPRLARTLCDTDDLVQDALMQTLRRLDTFAPRFDGALQAYLRQALLNRVRDQLRRAAVAPAPGTVPEDYPAGLASPLEEAIGAEVAARYEAALQRLRPEERELIVARVEMGDSYAQIAEALGKPSADAARMAVARALVRLAEEMDLER